MNNRNIFVFRLIVSFVFLCTILLGNIYIQSIASIVVILYLIKCKMNNRLVMLSFAMMLFFNINFLVPMVFDTSDSLFINSLYKTKYCYETIRCLNIFLFGILLFLKHDNKNDLEINNVSFNKVFQIVSYALVLLAFVISIFGIDRSYDTKNSGHISPIYELTYFLMFFSLFFSNNKKSIIISACLVSLFIIIQDLYYGGRITSLQMILVFFVYYIKKLKIWHFLILILLFFLFIIVGSTRSGKAIDIQTFNFVKIDTFYFAFQASETHLYVADILSYNERLDSFFGNLLNVIFIDTGKTYSVSHITWDYMFHYYGGYSFTNFYFWFGYFGVFLSGFLYSLLINYCTSKNSNIRIILLSFVVIAMPRWYVYDPFILIKYGIVLSIICYCIVVFINNNVSDRYRTDLFYSNLM